MQGEQDEVFATFDGQSLLPLRNTHVVSVKRADKALRLLRLRTPITVRGTLNKPAIRIDAPKAAVQGGVATAIGSVLAPLAALLAFVDPGLAKDADCAALLAEAEPRANK